MPGSFSLRSDFCGIGRYRAPWLQRFATAGSFTALACAVTLVQGAYLGYTVGVLTQLERRFGLSSSHSGALLSAYDLGHAASVLLVGRIGPALHKPLCVAQGALLSAIACCALASTHFLFGALPPAPSAAHTSADVSLCNFNHTLNTTAMFIPMTSHAISNDTPTQTYEAAFILLLFYQLLCGIASSPFSTLIYIFIDDNASDKKTSFYFGLLAAMWGYGPAAGFGLAALCTKLFVTLDTPAHLSPSSPQWIGAWWIGFLILGALYICVGIFFVCFPQHLIRPSRTMIEMAEMGEQESQARMLPQPSEKQVTTEKLDARLFLLYMTEIPREIAKLVQCKVFVFATLSSVCMTYITAGYATFLPKYLEVHFYQTSHVANIFGGLVVTTCGATACVVGGKIMSTFQTRQSTSMALFAGGSLISALYFLLLMTLVKCPNSPIADYNLKQNTVSDNSSISCLNQCSCSTEFQPICIGNETYFSACTAGCRKIQQIPFYSKFDECSCAGGNSGIEGYCESDKCDKKFMVYMMGSFIATCAISMFQVAVTTTVIRSVPATEKSISYALSNFFCSIFGYIPSQVLYGKVIDTTCVLWSTSSSNSSDTFCQMYRNSMFRQRYHMFAAVVSFLAFLTAALCAKHSVKHIFHR